MTSDPKQMLSARPTHPVPSRAIGAPSWAQAAIAARTIANGHVASIHDPST